jgi:hypothetical protein
MVLAAILAIVAGCAQRDDSGQEKSGTFYGGVSGGWSAK